MLKTGRDEGTSQDCGPIKTCKRGFRVTTGSGALYFTCLSILLTLHPQMNYCSGLMLFLVLMPACAGCDFAAGLRCVRLAPWRGGAVACVSRAPFAFFRCPGGIGVLRLSKNICSFCCVSLWVAGVETKMFYEFLLLFAKIPVG